MKKNEIYVSGGCGAIYGLTLQTNMQYAFEATPENLFQTCGFKLDRSSVLSKTTGNKPTPNTPDTDLQAHAEAHVICDKITN